MNAKEVAQQLASEKGIGLKKFVEDVLKNYDYGLKLVGKERFSVTSKVIKDPQGYLDNLVKKIYNKEK